MTLPNGTGTTTWAFGGNATPSSGTDNPQDVVFTATGFNNIVHASSTYRAFAYFCCESLADVADMPVVTVTIYPNPNEGKFTIDFGTDVGAAEVKLIDVNGRVVYLDDISGVSYAEVNLEQPAGVYILQLTIDGNTSMYRIVKQ
jgi:hypothetical protein